MRCAGRARHAGSGCPARQPIRPTVGGSAWPRPSVPQPANAVCSTGGARPGAATSLRPSAPVALRLCHASSALRCAAPLARVCSARRASAARPSLRAPFAHRKVNGGTRSPRVMSSLARTASAAVPMLVFPCSCAPGRGTCAVRTAEATSAVLSDCGFAHASMRMWLQQCWFQLLH